MIDGSHTRLRWATAWHFLLCAPAYLIASPAHAFLLQGEALDTAASVLAVVVLFVVPIVGVVVFWLLHVMPEKIAHKRHHPQRDAIHTLCILSLFFGGLLWPLAFLWAYSKPVLHQLAYGKDKHDDFYSEEAAAASADSERVRTDLARLRGDVEHVLAGDPEELTAIRAELAALETRIAAAAPSPPPAARSH